MARRRKKPTLARRVFRAAWPALLWLVFVWWYTNTSGPLSQQEVEQYVTLMEERGIDPERRELLRGFLESDTGDDFVMLNLIELNEKMPPLEGLAANATATDALDRYMAHMWPALIRRASHPVSGGTAAAAALDVWGVEGAKAWSQGAFMRYRSRRDLIEIATDPDFMGPHDYKIAAMSKTIAVPLDPWFNSGDPRLILGLVALILSLIGARK